MTAETNTRRPFRGAVTGVSVTEGFCKEFDENCLTPPFRSAQHLPCKGGKKNPQEPTKPPLVARGGGPLAVVGIKTNR